MNWRSHSSPSGRSRLDPVPATAWQQGASEDPPQHGSDLEQRLQLGIEAIHPLEQHAVNGGRYGRPTGGLGEGETVVATGEIATFLQGAHEFLEEQRVAVRPDREVLGEASRCRYASGCTPASWSWAWSTGSRRGEPRPP